MGPGQRSDFPAEERGKEDPSFLQAWGEFIFAFGIVGILLGLGFLVYWVLAWIWWKLTGRAPGPSSPIGLLLVSLALTGFFTVGLVALIVLNDGP